MIPMKNLARKGLTGICWHENVSSVIGFANGYDGIVGILWKSEYTIATNHTFRRPHICKYYEL